MNLRQIETFAAVMRCGTASRAAELLGVTQPAVSRSIVEFERSVGFPLFARIRNRLVATPEARMLYDDVVAAFQGIDTIRASAARIRDRGSGEIRVASLSALGNSGGPSPGLAATNDVLVVFAGGIPVRDAAGNVIGAVGVSGGAVDQDYVVALAATAALIG